MKKIYFILFIISLSLFLAIPAQAESINLDFGSNYGPPSSAFGGAANQIGPWNDITTFAGSNLIDIYGTTTGVNYSIVADTMGGAMSGGIPEGSYLVNDNFYRSTPSSWSLTLTGLDLGLYDVFYYGPRNGSVDTGDFLVNGILASSITGGEYNGTFTQGVHYDVVNNVTVNDGTMAFNTTSLLNYQGLAGIQLVTSNAIPEPTTLLLLGSGLVGLGLFRKKSRKK